MDKAIPKHAKTFEKRPLNYTQTNITHFGSWTQSAWEMSAVHFSATVERRPAVGAGPVTIVVGKVFFLPGKTISRPPRLCTCSVRYEVWAEGWVFRAFPSRHLIPRIRRTSGPRPQQPK